MTRLPEIGRQPKLKILTKLYDVGTPDPKYVESELLEIKAQRGLRNPFNGSLVGFSNSSGHKLTEDEKNLLGLLFNQLTDAEIAHLYQIKIIPAGNSPNVEHGEGVLNIRHTDIKPGLAWYHETGHVLYDALDAEERREFRERWAEIQNKSSLWRPFPGNLIGNRHLNHVGEAFAEMKAMYVLGSQYTRAFGSIRQTFGSKNAEWYAQLMKKYYIKGSIDE